eukprot:9433814-Pyramimonas_sp.AAC.1
MSRCPRAKGEMQVEKGGLERRSRTMRVYDVLRSAVPYILVPSRLLSPAPAHSSLNTGKCRADGKHRHASNTDTLLHARARANGTGLASPTSKIISARCGATGEGRMGERNTCAT